MARARQSGQLDQQDYEAPRLVRAGLTPDAQLDQVIGAAVGIRYLRQVAKGTIVPDKDRIRAAVFLIKRQYGTALIAIELPAEPVDLPHGLITRPT